MNDLLAMFVTVFLAEFGDKTQLATMLFASERKMPPLMVFAACGGALVLSAAIATFLGTIASRYLAGVPFYRNDLVATSLVLTVMLGVPALVRRTQAARAQEALAGK